MEYVVEAGVAGTIGRITVAPGDPVQSGDVLALVDAADAVDDEVSAPHAVPADEPLADREAVRPGLAEVVGRHAAGLDAARPDAVDRRRRTGQRTTRENVDDLCDPGSFVEYGLLAIAAQRRRRSLDDLIARTPADGLVAGVGTVGGTPTAVLSYDYTVLAGTQGYQNHRKKDRLFDVIERQRLPVVFFAEGGGGRPGDTDAPGVSGLDVPAFHLWGGLSGLVPMVGITSGRCFAGNAALLGCCDVVIATAGSNIGMGGPAMIDGGGLGAFAPEEIGPLDVQVANGVVDIAVADEAEAVAAAKRYLAYFAGLAGDWSCADQAGAIDADGADKSARFMQLCDAFDLPLLFLCDTPGIMVGPDAEDTALVRHASRLFVTGASLTVPYGTIILRKAYGLGAQAMAGGSFKAPLFCVAWPTGEVGGMGLEGAVRLGFRKELDAIDDPGEREQAFDAMVAQAYEHGRALSSAAHFEIDDVIDPADSRRWIATTFAAAPPSPPRTGKKRPAIDTW